MGINGEDGKGLCQPLMPVMRKIGIPPPQAMNSIGPGQHDRMVEIWQEFRDDPEALVAIITGAGNRAF